MGQVHLGASVPSSDQSARPTNDWDTPRGIVLVSYAITKGVKMSAVTLKDGRTLAWAEQGDPNGKPLLTLHGSPGSRLNRLPLPDRLAQAGIRNISFDRPGYGGSDPLPGRRVADVAADVEDLLDALEIGEVAVWGGSGGGPHAIALATLLSQRCTVVHCEVSPGPALEMGRDLFLEGMDPQNVRLFQAALRGRQEAFDEFARDLDRLVAKATSGSGELFADMDLPESDREILRSVRDSVTPGFIEAARQGPWGLIDDFIAIGCSPWGFDPAQASAPVILSYGSDDVNVPARHGDWLAANVPTIEIRVSAAHGHLKSPDERFATFVELVWFGD